MELIVKMTDVEVESGRVPTTKIVYVPIGSSFATLMLPVVEFTSIKSFA